jgi:hypothetical protein
LKINLERQIDVPISGLLTYDEYEINYDSFRVFMSFKKTKVKKGVYQVELFLSANKIKVG